MLWVKSGLLTSCLQWQHIPVCKVRLLRRGREILPLAEEHPGGILADQGLLELLQGSADVPAVLGQLF